jgi:two-component system cell cycle sensor histidine kinase PleC
MGHQVGLANLAVDTTAEADIAPDVLAALDALRVAVTVFDSAQRLTYFNEHFHYLFRSLPRCESLMGQSYAQLVQREIDAGQIAPGALVDGGADFVASRLRQLSEAGFAPYDVPLADGRVMELKTRRTREGGWIVLWSDATRERHALSRLEDAIELSADAFAFWNADDEMILANTVFAEMHGYAHSDAMHGLSFEDVLDHAMKRGKFVIEGPRESWASRRVDAHLAPAGALTVVTASGEAYLVRERATRDGGSATVFTDVTDRHRVESALGEQTRALTKAKRALEKSKSAARRQASYLADVTRRLNAVESEADTAKTALLRAMSHELKTPLNAILGFSDLLQAAPDRFNPEQIGEYAGLIHMAGGNLLRLINQILDLTKLAAGRYVLRRKEVGVGGELWNALRMHSARAAEKSIALEIGDCANDLLADADESAFAMMVDQLVDNAVSFTNAGGAVKLSAVRDEGFIRVIVADNGPGVAAEDLVRILEPFEQVGRSASDHADGAGLGLPLVKALAELHGGLLVVESEVGAGLTATLEIPAAAYS